VLAFLGALPEWHVVGFFDDGIQSGAKINAIPVLGDRNALRDWKEPLAVVIAIGSATVKKEIGEFLLPNVQLHYPVLIHPKAVILDASRVKIGGGSMVTAGAVITTDVTIGKHVLINLNVTIGHDTHIEDYVSVMPGVNLAGEVHIGKASLVGSGANILNRCSIGKNSVIGSGSVVTKNIGDHKVAVGIPARVLKEKA
jgi:sugar O-acyltransferase (sialic acid O-acetyltransferase NeuD family)